MKSIVMSSIYFHLIKVQERERNRQNGGGEVKGEGFVLFLIFCNFPLGFTFFN